MLHLLLVGFAAFAADPSSSDWVERLGGKVERNASGKPVAVNLRGTWVNDAEMVQLAAMPDLERLDLSHTRITDEGLMRLKTAPKIRELNLYYSEWITDQGLTAIAGWKHLRRLNVRGTRVSDGTLEIVAKLTDLEALDIAHTQVTDNGLEHLITLVQLKELAMGGGRRSPAAFTVLRMLPTLTYLDLSGARPGAPDMANRESTGPGIPEQTLKAIAELKDLKVLKLGHSNITSGGLKTLQSLDKVEKLGLEGCKRIDDSSIEILGQWKSLKYLDLQDTQVSAGAIEGLRKARPELAVLSVKK